MRTRTDQMIAIGGDLGEPDDLEQLEALTRVRILERLDRERGAAGDVRSAAQVDRRRSDLCI